MCHSLLDPHKPTIIPDSLKDERFIDNPLVTSDPKIRFYAGIPLVTSENCALGTLCVIDKVPRQLTENQMQALKTIANQVVTHLKLRKANLELSKLSKKLSALNDFRTQLFETSSQEFGLPVSEIRIEAESLLNDDTIKKNVHLHKRLNFIIQYCEKLTNNIYQFQSAEKIYDPA